MEEGYPILEFDPNPEAVIEPGREIKAIDIPEHCVICFFSEVFAKLSQDGTAKVLAELRWENGPHPVYELEVGGRRLAAFHPGVGAPLAAGLLEEVIALGCKKFVSCGGAGVLDRDVAIGQIVVPVSAVRDEGTSSGPHHQDSGEAKIRESTAGVSRKPSSDCKACGCSSKHLCGLTAWNT